ncbi:hypothetical protein BCR34DRAFT_606141 [Clohesyomyces aquaticus]|uniref:AA1-like domain-containing protein n=1 Tax=Clohesyomyces aquaticus TaxID=1231657 RepID=A0A1Y1YS98_9PLEO|nr:hypothetical protein BCR34DRAFT_606141 [Clohesyomyces aquaticus]
MYYSVSVAVSFTLALANAGSTPEIIDRNLKLQKRSGNPITSCGANWILVSDLTEFRSGYANATRHFCNDGEDRTVPIRCSLAPGASCSATHEKYRGASKSDPNSFGNVRLVGGLPGTVNFTITNLGSAQLDVKTEDCISGMMQVAQPTVKAQDGTEVTNTCWRPDGNDTLGGTFEIPGVASYQALPIPLN